MSSEQQRAEAGPSGPASFAPRDERGTARHAVLVAVVATLVVSAVPVYVHESGWIRPIVAAVAVSAILCAHTWPWGSVERGWERHVRRCSTCQGFAGGCSRWWRRQELYDLKRVEDWR